jgi:predicted hotdog family 3-hydroxylacyl-ACP dehydratase
MCLLEEVVDWNADGATVVTRTHLASWNPLRSGNGLSAISLCEYGAQAMAVHGALVARASGKSLAPGLLVSLRDVELLVASADELPGELRVEVERLGGAGGLQYRFRVSHAGAVVAQGRAAIIESRTATLGAGPPSA